MEEGISWHWDDEARRIMVVTYKGRWTWTEHHQIINETLAERKNKYPNDFAYIIIGMADTSIPQGSNAVAHNRDVGDDSLMIIVTTNLFIRTLVRVGITASRQQNLYRVVESFDAAYALIAEHQSTQD